MCLLDILPLLLLTHPLNYYIICTVILSLLTLVVLFQVLFNSASYGQNTLSVPGTGA
jgi:hypothetical protein